MNRLLRFLILVTAFTALARAQTEEANPRAADSGQAPKTLAERYTAAGVKFVEGPAQAKLGKTAEFQVPKGQLFIGEEGLDKFFELTRNRRNGNEVGVIISEDYTLFFDYDEVGYVKDDEKDKLDPKAMLESMQANQAKANEARKERGWDEMRIVGWAHEPYYDEATHNLKWALYLSSSADGFKTTWINESIRLLGRSGLMNVTLVCDNDIYPTITQVASTQLKDQFAYVSGQRYEEFKKGDKIAEYGLTALVLGGGAIAAAKMGLFGHLATFFAKMGKAIIVGVVAIGAAIAKFFGKLIGARKDDDKPST